ncbi:RNA-directed DNA polymerase, eukaryota [Tanacetum coccineum]
MGYNMEGCLKDIKAIISSQADFQETKVEKIDLFSLRNLWDNFLYDFAFSPSVRYSGGLLCVRGLLLLLSSLLFLFMRPKTYPKEKPFGSILVTFVDQWDGESVILGDFNDVKSEQERFGTNFNASSANAFNQFISTAGLVDLPLEDILMDKGMANEDLVKERTSLIKDLQDIKARHALDMAQKVKIHWAIEGDENSTYWIKEPSKVINEFLTHFSNLLSKPTGPSINLDPQMFRRLSTEQNVDLESNVTYEEIRKAVWDCGSNKSPGPDGFTFDFIRKYWKIIDQDVVNAV